MNPLELLAQQIPDFHMWVIFATVIGALIAYASEKIHLITASLAVLAFLLLFFHFIPYRNEYGDVLLPPSTLLLGLANSALIAVMALLVIGQAVVRTGALNDLAQLIMKCSGHNMWIATGLCLLVVLVVSAFLNNTPVVVIFIPILSMMAKELKFSNSMTMMPLSYVAILGGMTTLIGSSTNLLVSGQLQAMGLKELGFFDFVLPGSVLAAVGLVYALVVLPRILPDRASLQDELVGEDNRRFVAQIEVEYGSDLAGKSLADKEIFGEADILVKMLQRAEHAYLPPFQEDLLLQPGDVLVVSSTRQVLTELLAKSPTLLLHKFPEMTEPVNIDRPDSQRRLADVGLAEVVIAPASRMIGQTLEQIGFRYNYGCIVLGIQRRSRVIRTRLTEMRLAAGDVLLVLGEDANLLRLQHSNDVLVMEWSSEAIPNRRHARLAAGVFLSVVGLAASDVVPIYISSILGAVILVGAGCINFRQAARSMDGQIVVLVATSIALSTALQVTGGAAFLAELLTTSMDGMSPTFVMSAMFLLMAALTNVLSNNASAVLFTPIAVNTAYQLGVDPMMFIFAVIFASNCSFATPIGYQTNLLVMGPGHYKFVDFMRAGIPLVLLIWVTYTLFAHWYFEGGFVNIGGFELPVLSEAPH